MTTPTFMPRLRGFRFPLEIIAYAVWVYHRFALSMPDIADLLAERASSSVGMRIRLWVNRFGSQFAACIRRGRPWPHDNWHKDEVAVPINGVKHWLRRAIDGNRDVPDSLIQPRRNAKAAKRFFGRLVAANGERPFVIKDKLHSYTKLIKPIAPGADHRRTRDSTIGLKRHIGRRVQAVGRLCCRTIGLIARVRAYSNPRQITWQCHFIRSKWATLDQSHDAVTIISTLSTSRASLASPQARAGA